MVDVCEFDRQWWQKIERHEEQGRRTPQPQRKWLANDQAWMIHLVPLSEIR